MKDLAGHKPLENASNGLLKEVQRVMKNTYDTWCEDTLHEIETNEVKYVNLLVFIIFQSLHQLIFILYLETISDLI